VIIYTWSIYKRRGAVRTAKLFKNGGSQAVRLPKEFRFEGSRVFIKKVGEAVVLLPRQDSWDMLFDSLEQFTDDFMGTRDQPKQQDREGLFE
jgi:antitoxin VapB